MEFPRIKLSVRSSMALIALVAILFGAGLAESRRRSLYTYRRDYHLQQLEGSPPATGGLFFDLPRPAQANLIRAWIVHASMFQKYETALRIPFYYVPADPAGFAAPDPWGS